MSSSLFPEPARPARTRTAQHAWVNAHCDGGARGNPGPAGYGALIQDDQGTVLAELSEFLGHRTNNYAEYSGLLGCLQWALEHEHPRLRVVSDSELMVKQIQGKYKVNSPDLRPMWEEARKRIGKLEAFEISHALRHKNKDADRLANEAMDRGSKGSGAGSRPVAGAPAPGGLAANAPGATRSTLADPAKRTSATTSSAAGAPASSGAISSGAKPGGAKPAEAKPTEAKSGEARMLRGFTRGGSIQLLGGATLPDGVFVKVIVE